MHNTEVRDGCVQPDVILQDVIKAVRPNLQTAHKFVSFLLTNCAWMYTCTHYSILLYNMWTEGVTSQHSRTYFPFCCMYMYIYIYKHIHAHYSGLFAQHANWGCWKSAFLHAVPCVRGMYPFQGSPCSSLHEHCGMHVCVHEYIPYIHIGHISSMQAPATLCINIVCDVSVYVWACLCTCICWVAEMTLSFCLWKLTHIQKTQLWSSIYIYV